VEIRRREMSSIGYEHMSLISGEEGNIVEQEDNA
jgi:hypothetical protein